MTQIVINPGSGPVAEGSIEQSEINIKAFIEDLERDDEIKYSFYQVEKDGRHTYYLWNDKERVEVEMPPLPLEKVRYMQEEGQNIWHFPRLYVNGSSWVWCYALGVCFDDEGED